MIITILRKSLEGTVAENTLTRKATLVLEMREGLLGSSNNLRKRMTNDRNKNR